MRYIGFGMGTAAALALTTAWVFWVGAGPAIALDKVADKAAKAESVTYVEKQTVNQAAIELTFSLRGPLMRAEAAGRMVQILDTKDKTGIMLYPHKNAFVRIDQNSQNKLLNLAGGQSPIEILLALKDRTPNAIVEELLDGKKTQKATVKVGPETNPPGDWTIWVDPKSELPVKMAFRGTLLVEGKQVPFTRTTEKFEWNVKLDDTLFRLEPPAGYVDWTPVPKADVPKIN